MIIKETIMLVEIPVYIENVIKQQAEIQGITAEQVVQKALASQFKIERPFNFEIDEIQQALDSGFHPMPKFNSDEEFLAWANA